MKKILILNANPDENSLCNALAQKYLEGAKKSDYDIKIVNLRELSFDPILHHGYNQVQELENDLKDQQELIKWCEHLVIVTPLWWGSVPALLKGYFDRVLLPGFAFKFKPNGKGWDKLLKGRSATVIYTQGAPFWFSFLFTNDAFWTVLNKSVLDFCGFKPVLRFVAANVSNANEKKREAWLEKVFFLGVKGY